VLFAAFLLVASGCRTDTNSSRDEQPGEPPDERPAVTAVGSTSMDIDLPGFEKTTMSGDTLRAADLHGQITLVNFWATWCGPCVVEMPELIGLRAEWKDRPFEIVGVSMDEEGFDVVRPFAEDFGVNYPVILDDGPLADEFGGVYGLPTTFIVDADGTVIHRSMGIFPMDRMRDELDEMIRRIDS
jgi:thiol-disulfide isomerase/thioredoxin